MADGPQTREVRSGRSRGRNECAEHEDARHACDPEADACDDGLAERGAHEAEDDGTGRVDEDLREFVREVARDALHQGLHAVGEPGAVAVEEEHDEGDEGELQEDVAHVDGCIEKRGRERLEELLHGGRERRGVDREEQLVVKPRADARNLGDGGRNREAAGDPFADDGDALWGSAVRAR